MSVRDNTYGIADLQDAMLNIFKHFASICEANGLRYFLAGGTCLGALRHQGFIPWDDDLDVYMPRPDYERLWQLMGKGRSDGRFALCRTDGTRNYHHRVMQLVDLNTTFIHSRCKNEDIEHGLYIDIIPLDGCPDRPLQRFGQFVDAILFSICNIQCRPEYNGGRLTKLMCLGTDVLLFLIHSPKARYRVWRAAERRMTRYSWDSCNMVKCITSQFHELMTPFPKAWFEPRMAAYEDTQAVIPKEAEAYCEKMYGNYMQLPPVEKRAVRHNVEYIDLHTGYKAYKGRYYCVESQGEARK